MVQKVISGGQVGVAQAALRAAARTGVAVGGWCSPGGAVEDALRVEFGLTAPPTAAGDDTGKPDPGVAADWNVRDADVTLVFRPAALTVGDPVTDRTFAAAHRCGQPVLVCDPADTQTPAKVVEWLRKTDAWIVNVTGPSEAIAPGIGDQVQGVLLQVFRREEDSEKADATSGRREKPEVQRARMQNDAAWKIHRLRAQSGLNQLDLARLMGTSRSAIYRLEDPDYWGHSLPVLRRLAAAVGSRLEIRFVPQGERSSSPSTSKS